MELKDTIKLMNSADYKERFKAEYLQTKIRYEKLKAFNNKIEAALMSCTVEMPKHDCPETLLLEQESTMENYLHILEVRAQIENIDLSVIECRTCGKCAHAHKIGDKEYECDAEVYDIDTLSCFVPREE